VDPEQLRRPWIDELAADHGDEGIADHAVMLDTQWRYLVEQKFLD
jgi:hypothetical protein